MFFIFVMNLKPQVTQNHCPPVHGPLYGPLYRPVHRPPLRVPMKTIIKMTVRDLTYCLFCLFFVIVASFTVMMKGGPAYIYVEKDR